MIPFVKLHDTEGDALFVRADEVVGIDSTDGDCSIVHVKNRSFARVVNEAPEVVEQRIQDAMKSNYVAAAEFGSSRLQAALLSSLGEAFVGPAVDEESDA